MKMCDRCGKPLREDDQNPRCSVPLLTYNNIMNGDKILSTYPRSIEQTEIDICHDCLLELAHGIEYFLIHRGFNNECK